MSGKNKSAKKVNSEQEKDSPLKQKYSHEQYEKHINHVKNQLQKLSEATPEVAKTQIDILSELKLEITELIAKGYTYDSISKAISNKEITFLPKTMKRLYSKKTPIFIKTKEMIRIGKDKNGNIVLVEINDKKVKHILTEEEFSKEIIADTRNKNFSRLWNWAENFLEKHKETLGNPEQKNKENESSSLNNKTATSKIKKTEPSTTSNSEPVPQPAVVKKESSSTDSQEGDPPQTSEPEDKENSQANSA